MSFKVSLWRDPALWSSVFIGPVITFEQIYYLYEIWRAEPAIGHATTMYVPWLLGV
jgi:hypothetical protein